MNRSLTKAVYTTRLCERLFPQVAKKYFFHSLDLVATKLISYSCVFWCWEVRCMLKSWIFGAPEMFGLYRQHYVSFQSNYYSHLRTSPADFHKGASRQGSALLDSLSRAFGSVYSLLLTVAFCWRSAAELVRLLVLTQWAFLILSTSTSPCPCDGSGRGCWLPVSPAGVPASMSCLCMSTRRICLLRISGQTPFLHHRRCRYYKRILPLCLFTGHVMTHIRQSWFHSASQIPEILKCVFQTGCKAEN